MKITIEDIKKNNARFMYVKCKAAQEDLEQVRATFGENSSEYQKKLEQTMSWFKRSFPDLLELAISRLTSLGHDKLIQTSRTDELSGRQSHTAL